jgi:hypothetical protein
MGSFRQVRDRKPLINLGSTTPPLGTTTRVVPNKLTRLACRGTCLRGGAYTRFVFVSDQQAIAFR